MQAQDFDVLILGAGAAGLAAAMRLSRAGKRVLMLEARDRIGGRIQTIEVEGNRIELGAEFIHGRTPVVFDLLERYGLKTREVEGDRFCNRNRELVECDFFEEVTDVLDRLKKYEGPDISFEESLGALSVKEDAKQWSRNYVAGFHGAPPGEAGLKGILNDAEAEEDIDGDRSWRIEGGYSRLVDCIWEECEKSGVELRLDTVVERVIWGEGVRLFAVGEEFRAKKAIVTLPVSVLQSNAVEFVPPFEEKRSALQGIAMGDVARCVLIFRRRWWVELSTSGGKSMADLSFVFSDNEDFPTWWTQNPSETPTLVGWASAISAPRLTGMSQREIEARAVAAIAKILMVEESVVRSEVVSAHWHDWCADPFTRGAYTYARVRGSGMYGELARSLRDTLFFAGEATDSTGNHATVHGALASGYRAADEVLSAGEGE